MVQLTSQSIHDSIHDLIKAKKAKFNHFEADDYWLGATVDTENQWSWLASVKHFESFNQWQNGLKGAGCPPGSCTGNEALHLRYFEDSAIWRAAHVSQDKGYVCAAKCKIGFKWVQTLQRCLKIETEPR